MRVVKLERKECMGGCSLKGWAGDNYLEEGVFNFNGKVVVELPVLHDIRRSFVTGSPIATWAKNFLQGKRDDIQWQRDNPVLANR